MANKMAEFPEKLAIFGKISVNSWGGGESPDNLKTQ